MHISGAPDEQGLMVNILAFSFGKSCWIFCLSHSMLPGENSSETVHSTVSSVAGPNGLSCCRRLSQGWDQTLIDEPLSTAHPMFCARRSRPSKIPRYPWEAELFAVQFKKSSSLQYFPSSTRPRRLSGLLSMHQLSFARKASLKL